MASKIRILSDQTINKIAAGEVIENPASVVKELVENSLDAGATEICVEIKGGGRQLIRISDNGCGMSQDDALLCLERHATSKIRDVEEIHSLSTMGFRGEAIPSIASISKMTILTTPEGVDPPTKGSLIMIDGGKIVQCAEAARSQGTTMEVKALFYNVPVRKKFQKSPTYDVNEIYKSLSMLALGYPNISFQLISQGKTLLQTTRSSRESFLEELRSRVLTVLGEEFHTGVRAAEKSAEEIAVQGLFSLPHLARNNRTGQYLFINRRAVFSPLVSFAVKEAYGTSLANGKFPAFILHLTMPGHLVDVNVHPQKKEVRIRQDQLLKELISKAVDQALQAHSFQREVNPDTNVEPPIIAPSPFDSEWTFQSKKPSWSDFSANLHKETLSPPPVPQQSAVEIRPLLFPKEKITAVRALATIPRYILLDNSSLSEDFKQRFGSPSKHGLYLVDQKAAYSRVVFERLQRHATKNETLPVQSLLIPYIFELPFDQASLMRENIDHFAELGIHIKEFHHTFVVDALPEIFGNTDVQLFIKNLLEGMQNHPHDKELFKKERENRIALAATRAAASQDSRQSIEEAQTLLNQLFICHSPYHCPQGRTTIVHFSQEDLAKQFLKC